MPASVVKLVNPIRRYEWGSRQAIAALQRRPHPTPTPEAELWVGDHPTAPSQVLEAAGLVSLPDWLARDPVCRLGPGRTQLPFLAKVLAAGRPLSVQVHPDADQARAGFERERREGVDAASRCYSDPNGKHEVLVALSRFESLCGFRADAEVERCLRGAPGTDELLAAAPEQGPLAVRLLAALLRAPRARARAVAKALADPSGRAGPEAAWIARLCDEHPGDPLALAPVCLNHVVLDPGRGLVVRPGTVHAHLLGTGVEVMTPSDNVVRGGLTAKHVDPDELARISVPRAGPPETIEGRGGAGPEIVYPTGTDAFDLLVLQPQAGRVLSRPGGRVSVLLCVEGAVSVDEVSLSSGEAALVPAGVQGYELRGSGGTARVFEVSSG